MAIKDTVKRLEDEIKWYSTKSKTNQKLYKTFQIIELAAAASIPFFSSNNNTLITSFLGVLIVITHGVQSLFQFQEHWISYRSTAESLKHEKFLWKASAGPYGDTGDANKLLAERIESLISQEHAKWIVDKEKLKKKS